MNLRRWQQQALTRVRSALAQPRKRGVIVQAVMGAGKSILAATFAKQFEHVVVTTPRRLLVEQLRRTFKQVMGHPVGAYYSDHKIVQPITVCCNDSLASLAAQVQAPDLLVIDECHRSECDSVLSAVDTLSPARILGLSATPWRGLPGQRLSLFDDVIFSYGLRQALQDAVLVPYDVTTLTPERAKAWGCDVADLDACCLAWIKRAPGPGITSASSVADAEQFAGYLRRNGVPAQVITGNTNQVHRETIMTRLQCGVIRCIVHVNILAEGADFPWLRWLVLRRKVSSTVRFPQEVGRVLRTHPGKNKALVFDPHAVSLDLSIEAQARLWSPVRIAVLDNGEHTQALNRWLSRRGFESAHTAPTVHALCDLIERHRLVHALVWSDQDLTPTQHAWVAGAPALWGSDRFCRLYYASPRTIERAVHVLLRDDKDTTDLDKQADEIERWCERTGKTIVGASLWSEGAPDLQDIPRVVAYHVDWIPRSWGVARSGAIPTARSLSTVCLSSDEAWLHEMHLRLDQAGYVTRRGLPRSAWLQPPTDRQLAALQSCVRRAWAWVDSASEQDRARLRRLCNAALAGALPLGMTSDLLGVLVGCERAGKWLVPT